MQKKKIPKPYVFARRQGYSLGDFSGSLQVLWCRDSWTQDFMSTGVSAPSESHLSLWLRQMLLTTTNPTETSSGSSNFWADADVPQRGWISLLWACGPIRDFWGTQSVVSPVSPKSWAEFLKMSIVWNSPDENRLHFLNLLAQPQRYISWFQPPGPPVPTGQSAPHQQHQRWAADQGDGCGEFSLIAPTVGASQAVRIERQAQALNTPVCHLGKRKESYLGKTSKHPRSPPVQSLQLPDLTQLGWQKLSGNSATWWLVPSGTCLEDQMSPFHSVPYLDPSLVSSAPSGCSPLRNGLQP